jgi:hypothetical protein
MADQCIEFQGPRTSKGYGQLNQEGKVQYAHRAAWEQANGPIPAGMVIMHTCDNPPCINPLHLQMGTQGDNLRDMTRKGRHWMAGNTHCVNGHEYNETNTLINTRGRVCRVCRNERLQMWRLRHGRHN